MSKGKFNYSDFKQLYGNFKDYNNSSVKDKVLIEVLTEVGLRALRKVKEKTPVGQYSSEVNFTTEEGKVVSFNTNNSKVGGNLRRNWFLTDIKKVGDTFYLELYNNVDYASYVENGHRKRNNKGWVEGRFMLAITIKEIEAILPNLVGKKTEQILKRLMEI